MTLITATTRLSRELQREYDRKQVAAGLSTWPTAHILPFQAWLAELWDRSVYSGKLAGPYGCFGRLKSGRSGRTSSVPMGGAPYWKFRQRPRPH